MQEKALFADAFLYQPSILKRLKDEFVEASREFRENPKSYLASAVKGDGIGGHRRKMLLRFGLALGIVIYALAFGFILVMWSIHAKPTAEAQEELELRAMVNMADFQQQEIPDIPKDGKKASGGGGGGRQEKTPASKGQLPKFSLTPPIIAPTTRPQLRPPALPVMETVQVDPRLQPPRDEFTPTGLPTGVPGPPSDGPGSGNGIGTGTGGGIGSGDGSGVGTGRGYNMGGGDPGLGSGTGNRGPATAVDTKPMPLNRPQPQYTEEALKNKIEGSVLARVLVGADGSVKQVKISRGLPDGLNEQAIQAAYKIRFRPAMKSGQPVAYWIPVEIAFTIR
jgi:TonB family protein